MCESNEKNDLLSIRSCLSCAPVKLVWLDLNFSFVNTEARH